MWHIAVWRGSPAVDWAQKFGRERCQTHGGLPSHMCKCTGQDKMQTTNINDAFVLEWAARPAVAWAQKFG